MGLEFYQPRGVKSTPLNKPLCSLRNLHFYFNVEASKYMDLDNHFYAQIGINEAERQIVFVLFKDKDDKAHYLKIGRHRGKGRRNDYHNITAKGLFNDYKWLKHAGNPRLPTKNRAFEVKEYPALNHAYYIQLRPSFEYSVEPENINSLDNAISGIYRYRNDSNDIIYIGKGNIKDRYKQQQDRQSWGIKTIEYSIINDDAKEFEAERYWIERFEIEHNRLPAFNMQRGHQQNNSSS
ncbi:MAG: hypothetical protein OXF49_02265 [Candidatus Saccharibacteria bacterium]|nr:hypothetical protein [Candidatus Saccharibacteria bacterium]